MVTHKLGEETSYFSIDLKMKITDLPLTKFQGAYLYNKLPQTITSASNLSQFKSKLFSIQITILNSFFSINFVVSYHFPSVIYIVRRDPH